MSKHSFDLPPVWALGAAVASWLLALLVPLAGFPFGFDRGLIAIGVLLILWSAWWFWRKKTTIEPRHTPKALIVEGPYRINRNPIYTGLTLILAGWALSLGALSALIPALVFPFIITRRFVIPEEAALRDAFGDEAERYIAASRRW